MNLKEIEKMPDRMTTKDLKSLFQDALTEFRSKHVDKREFLLILSQLTDRQVMTYELLEESTRVQLDNMLCTLWNVECYEEVDIILSIVVNLGLENCFKCIKGSIVNSKDIDEMILNEILETIDEVGSNISNPYYELEKYK